MNSPYIPIHLCIRSASILYKGTNKLERSTLKKHTKLKHKKKKKKRWT